MTKNCVDFLCDPHRLDTVHLKATALKMFVPYFLSEARAGLKKQKYRNLRCNKIETPVQSIFEHARGRMLKTMVQARLDLFCRWSQVNFETTFVPTFFS